MNIKLSALMIALTVALLGCSSSGGGSGSSANDSIPPTVPQQPDDDSNSSENEGADESEPEKDDSFDAILKSLTTEQKAEMVGEMQVSEPLQNQSEEDKALYLELSKAFFGVDSAENPSEIFGFTPGEVGEYDTKIPSVNSVVATARNFTSSNTSDFNSVRQVGKNNLESSYGLLVYEAFNTNDQGEFLDSTNNAVVFAGYAGNPTLYSKSIDYLTGTATYKGSSFIGEFGGLRSDTQPERVLPGDFTLTANFDNKSVSGQLVDHRGDGWGITTLKNAEIKIINDQMTFKGDARLDNNYDDLTGTYEGKFMGPAASEVVGTASLDGQSIDDEYIRVEAAFGGSRQ